MITCVCGLPGNGKSYYMTREIMVAMKKGRPIFSNYPIDGAYELTFDDIVNSAFPEGSLIAIDEANSWFRNRDWAKLPKECFMFFMHHRHFKLDLIMCAQMPSTLDVNIRDIVSYFVWSKATFIPLTERVLWFNYHYFDSIENLSSFKNPFRTERRLPSKKVFNAFDTYYKFVELQREPIILKKWDCNNLSPTVSEGLAEPCECREIAKPSETGGSPISV